MGQATDRQKAWETGAWRRRHMEESKFKGLPHTLENPGDHVRTQDWKHTWKILIFGTCISRKWGLNQRCIQLVLAQSQSATTGRILLCFVLHVFHLFFFLAVGIQGNFCQVTGWPLRYWNEKSLQRWFIKVTE